MKLVSTQTTFTGIPLNLFDIRLEQRIEFMNEEVDDMREYNLCVTKPFVRNNGPCTKYKLSQISSHVLASCNDVIKN